MHLMMKLASQLSKDLLDKCNVFSKLCIFSFFTQSELLLISEITREILPETTLPDSIAWINMIKEIKYYIKFKKAFLFVGKIIIIS